MLERTVATRYVTPLREGGSLPGIVEADDDGMYVVKFRGAGQGLKVLVAEVLVAELARALDIATPRQVVIDVTDPIARYEADFEVQDLLRASLGDNLGIDYLPGALGYDGSLPPDADLAARILWLDALTANVDRTWANPNLLVWHRRTWVIDHGAALYVHHSWPNRAPDPGRFATLPFDASRHVLREIAGPLADRHDEFAARCTAAVPAAVAAVPADWLETTAHLPDEDAVRAAYRELLTARLGTRAWLPEDRA